MSEYVQTSVEEINLIAAQLRYKIESTLQLWSQQRQHAQSAKDERLSEIALGENFPDCRLSSSDTSSAGALVYLNGGDDLSVTLSKVEAAGGKILLPKTAIGPNGFMAHFTDTEGNKIGLHSMK